MKHLLSKKYISIGIVTTIVTMIAITFFFMIYRAEGFLAAISTIKSILTPFIFGLVLAYLLCPLYNLSYRIMKENKLLYLGKKDRSGFFAKIIASIISLIAVFSVILGLMWMVIPGLIDSITTIIKMLPEKYNELSIWIEETFSNVSNTSGPFSNVMDTLVANGQKWIEETLIPGSQTLVQSVSASILGILNGIKNFAIGIIICVFFLNSKEVFAAQSRKVIFATLDDEKAYKFLYGARFVNKTFGKFINGKLIDSLIIGILCFISMSILDWPYVMLISVIVGVTNIIPFFGPFIGAIPSALLILMVDPLTCVYFLIFILILQQLDGNVIGPKILGGSTGLPSFWVMFAILVGGGIFGFAGMVIGIPLFACIYAYTAYTVNNKLKKKGFTTDLEAYKKIQGILDQEADISDIHIECVKDKKTEEQNNNDK